jgi:hypothetical protein
MSRASAIAAARLQRSEKRAPSKALETLGEAPEMPSPDPVDLSRSVFKQCYQLCELGDFDGAWNVLVRVWIEDCELVFESKALPAMLMLSPEGGEGNTMLHLAARKGSARGVSQLLRIGANAAQRNEAGKIAADVAAAEGHADVAAMLIHHNTTWSGWGIVELSTLACLYDGGERFADCEAYLTRIVERDRTRHGTDGPQSLFRRALPTGLSLIDIARGLHTAEAGLLLELLGLEDEAAAEEAGADASPVGAVAGAEVSPVGAVAGAEVSPVGVLATPTAGLADVEWPDDGWTPPCVGYMVCALCKGRSGKAGRWGVIKELPARLLHYPLMVCYPCQAQGGLETEEGPTEVWVDETLRVEGSEGSILEAGIKSIAQMVHPTFGEIGLSSPVKSSQVRDIGVRGYPQDSIRDEMDG